MDFDDQDLKGRRLAHYMWSELEKIAMTPGSSGALGATAPASGALEGGVQREAEGAEEATPSHGIVASRVEQLDDKKARGTPVIQPPPGFVYAPELQSFVPDESNPGWMQAEQAAEAAKAKSFYDQGQQDVVQQQAQQQVDSTVEADMQQSMMAEQQQAQQQVQGQANSEATTKAVAKEQAKSVVSNLSAPNSVTGKAPSQPKAKAKAPAEKGVTIKIGKP